MNGKLYDELARAVRNRRFEQTEAGVLFSQAKLVAFGAFQAWTSRDPVRTCGPNVVTNEGILTALEILFHAATPVSAWYIAPFSSTSTPTGTITGANFTAQLTEFTAYDEATRVLWATDAASGTSIANTTTPATFTISTNLSDIYGAGLMTNSAKSNTTGKCYAAAQFSAPKLDMADGDILYVTYSAGLTSA
jgi:hypothetical protein